MIQLCKPCRNIMIISHKQSRSFTGCWRFKKQFNKSLRKSLNFPLRVYKKTSVPSPLNLPPLSLLSSHLSSGQSPAGGSSAGGVHCPEWGQSRWSSWGWGSPSPTGPPSCGPSGSKRQRSENKWIPELINNSLTLTWEPANPEDQKMYGGSFQSARFKWIHFNSQVICYSLKSDGKSTWWAERRSAKLAKMGNLSAGEHIKQHILSIIISRWVQKALPRKTEKCSGYFISKLFSELLQKVNETNTKLLFPPEIF